MQTAWGEPSRNHVLDQFLSFVILGVSLAGEHKLNGSGPGARSAAANGRNVNELPDRAVVL